MAQEVLGTAEARGIAKLWRYKARGDRFCLTGLTGLTTLPSSPQPDRFSWALSLPSSNRVTA